MIVPADAGSAACQECGACDSRCMLTGAVPGMSPRRMVRLLRLAEEGAVRESGFAWACTLCRRCTEDCPAGVRMDRVTRALRSRMTADGLAPKDLAEGIRVSLEMGNNSGISAQDFRETVEWLGEELGSACGDPAATLPLDVEGADILLVPNPREILSLPQLLIATARVLRSAGESWTLGSGAIDVTNWAHYTGDASAERAIGRRILDEAARLRVKRILATECGHGYRILRQDVAEWFPGETLPGVVSVPELFASYVEAKRIALDPARNPDPVTYHDPCNLGRKAGVTEEPRAVLRAAASRLVEMEPGRRLAWCCGGGGGAGQIGAQSKVRIAAGARKADQIRATCARVVVTSCQNCRQQIEDLAKKHGEKWEARTVAATVANALVEG